MAANKLKQDIEAIRSDLNKRQTFLTGCSKFINLLTELNEKQSDLLAQKDIIESVFGLVSRVATLLRTRYTDKVFWRSGRKVFLAGETVFQNAKVIPSPTDKLKSIAEWKKLADEELKDEEEGEKKPTAPSAPTTATTTPPPQQPQQSIDPSLLSSFISPGGNPSSPDVAAVAQLLGTLFQQIQTTTQGENGNREGNSEGNAFDLPNMMNMDEEALIEMVMRRSQEEYQERNGPPPASRDARYNLHVITIEEEGIVCSVCQEEFRKGSKAKQLPCSHFFHYKCSLEWLERHNTCPLCRHQLPSEKMHFDADAERIRNRPTEKLNLYS